MRVAVGFSIHTGWAVAVVLDERPQVLERLRLELAGDDQDSRFVYHAAAEQPAGARSRIEKAGKRALEQALAALSPLRPAVSIAALKPAGRELPPLESILGSHPLLHSAEGRLYWGAIAAACEQLGMTVVAPKPLAPELGKLKPPWGKDQKDAAALAWAALSTSPRGAPR